MSGHGLDKLARVRFGILLVALALTAIGVLFIHSTDDSGGSFPGPNALSQVRKALVALAAFVVVTRIDYRVLERFAYLIYGVLIAVLVGMLVLKAGSANRFLELRDNLRVQPSELMKVGVILALARYLRFREDQRYVRGLAVPVAITAVPMVLVVLQPDLGTSLMLPAILLGMLHVAGARARYIVLAILFGVSTIPAAYYLGKQVPIFRPYQLKRIQVFMSQGEGVAGDDSHQLRQSLIAIGSGGATGKGLGEGTQNTLKWVPERHTDFIYSIIGEEWGFVGAAGVALLFLLLVTLILRVGILTREPFGRLAVTGVAVALAAQSLENMGMTMALTPVTGIPLPFVSHGGSSLVTSYLALAIAFNVATRRVRVVASTDLAPEKDDGRPVIVQSRAAALMENRWPVR